MSKPVKMVSFRVRRRYFDAIVDGTKREEIRTNKPYWQKILLGDDPPQIAVFICGKDVHRRWITEKPYLGDPERLLGRPLSEQGIRDVLTNPAIVTPLGEKAIPLTCIPGGPPDYKEVLLGWTSPSEIAEHESLVKEIKESTDEAHYNRDCFRLDESLNREWDKAEKEFKESLRSEE